MANGQATLAQIRDYFEMSSGDFAKEWKALDTEEKEWFKIQVGREMNK